MSKSSSSPLRWAAPSWIMAGSVAENVSFLAPRVPGIGLCFYETDACLHYGPEDLPPPEHAARIHWHIHLPLDLPWHKGGRIVAALCARLCAKVAHCHPEMAVLHPPARRDKKALLADFSRHWHYPVPIALENDSSSDLLDLGDAAFSRWGFTICLDVAHAISYGHWALLNSKLVARASIWHWSAPAGGDRHLPLTHLSAPARALGRRMLAQASRAAIHVLEIFDWQGVQTSIPALMAMAEEQ